MSHIKEYKSSTNSPDDRNLGDEWIDWDGKEDKAIVVGKGLFLFFSAAVILLSDVFFILLVYLISPRLAMFFDELPAAAWILVGLYIFMTAFWFLEMFLTSYHEKNFFIFQSKTHLLFEWLFTRALKLSRLFGFSRDQMGHSFVKVYNSVSKAVKKPHPNEKLLVLLPRCLVKDELKKIMDFKKIYPIEICTVSGGELARKKVKEFRPTAIIGVACERDLVSGIKDVGEKFSVIGIPNKRPNGPCKDTYVDIDELEKAIKFYVGTPKEIVEANEARRIAS